MVKIRVTTHSGEDDEMEVEEYSATEITEQRNDNDIQAIQLGENSYSRIDIKNIKVVDEGKEETESTDHTHEVKLPNYTVD